MKLYIIVGGETKHTSSQYQDGVILIILVKIADLINIDEISNTFFGSDGTAPSAPGPGPFYAFLFAIIINLITSLLSYSTQASTPGYSPVFKADDSGSILSTSDVALTAFPIHI